MSGPELVIEGGRRARPIPALRELWRFRGLILTFAERDIRVKYKQAVLGVTWAVIQPLAFMLIFSIALGRGAGVSGGGAPYPAFVLSSLVAWTFLQGAVSLGTNSLVSDAAIIRKVYFPRETPILGAVVSGSVDFSIGVALFFVFGPFLGAVISPMWLLVPILGALLALIAAGASLALGSLNVYYRDFRHALPFLLQLWLFASPVAYPLTVIPEQWRLPYVVLNPAAGVLDAFRHVLALGTMPDLGVLGISAAGALVLLFVGYRIFKRMEPNFADVV